MNPIVAMENTLFARPELDWDARCAAIAESGFDGIYAVPYPLDDAGVERAANLHKAPARHGLALAGLYGNQDVALPVTAPWNARLLRLAERCAGVPRLEVSFKSSDPALRPAAATAAAGRRLEILLGLAERGGFDLAVYPHSFYPIESPRQAELLARRLAHRRLGFVFPSSHVYAVATADETAARLRECAGRIASFNFCGCRRLTAAPPGRCQHLPPGEGDLELAPLFALLGAARYAGPLILQGHGWNAAQGAALAESAQRTRRLVQENFPHEET
jgi:sugar phosphate isomerase/epimerase